MKEKREKKKVTAKTEISRLEVLLSSFIFFDFLLAFKGV